MKIGIAKSDITTFQEGVAMLGYGKPFNIMKSIETRLYARAFIFKNNNSKVAFVNCEICFITQSLKNGILEYLNENHPNFKYTDENLLLNAQHTHSGPSGYSHYGLYNASTPGFVSEIYNQLIEKISACIISAEKEFIECKLAIGKSKFSSDKEVGFQRSLKAYLQNPEAKNIDDNSLNLAIDREMTLLKISSLKDGKDLGSINWFGVHTTSLSNINTKLSFDNKGYAAQYFEEEKQNGFVSAFAQGSAGDVSPKFKYNSKRSYIRGKYDGKFEDDTKSAQYNGNLQYEKASEIYNKLANTQILTDDLDSEIKYVDFGNVNVNSKFTGGIEDITTSPSCMGVSFFYGSKRDGPGMVKPLYIGGKILAAVVKKYENYKALLMPVKWQKAMRKKYKAQGNKAIIIETGARKIFGTYNISKMIVPGWSDETVFALKEFHRKGAFEKHPLTQQVIPLQILKIGTLALISFPFEITTIASKRLKKTLEDILLIDERYSEIILCPYSNVYVGYLCTYEEYQVQSYEGGHTVFGEWSLAALQTEFEKMAIEMLKPKNERNIKSEKFPIVFSAKDLIGFKYYKNKVYKKFLKKQAKFEKPN